MTPDSFQAPTLEELSPLFPKYSIDAFIAQGGMGAVYLATQISLEREVAIKILPREFGADEEFRKSFAAEAKAMAKLNHPNLIGVYDFGEVDGMPFIVMEYVAGKPLHDSAYGKQIDPTEASRIVIETCRGLHHAHEHDILHRDVKPANILLDPRHAVPKLGDFGLAMATTDDSNDGLIYGTPGYAAPEVYEGNPDARSDVYAAAVILYQLITGQMPDNPYQHPSTLAQCSQRYDHLLAKALQPDASSRHQTADEFADELEAIQKAPAAPKPVTSRRPAAPLPSANKKSSAPIIGTIAALLILGGGFFFLNSNKTEDEPSKPSDDAFVFLPHEDPNTTPEASPQEESTTPEVKPAPIENPEMVAAQTEEPEEPQEKEEKTIATVKEPQPVAPETTEIKKTPLSTFDHLNFLTRGRNYCTEKGVSLLADYHDDLIKNIDRLEREGKSILRNEDYISNDDERARRNNIELTTKEFKEAGRLPSDLVTNVPESFSRLTYQSSIVGKALREAIAEQKTIKAELEENLQPLAEIYAKGVEKQAQLLSTEGNDYDASILTKEAKRARDNFTYFLQIVRGENPHPPALKNDPTHMPLEQLIVGSWQSESSETTFTFNKNGTSTGLDPTQSGSWTIEGEQIIADWVTHQDLITMVPQEHNRFLANFQGQGKLVYFSRLSTDLSSKQAENQPLDTPTGDRVPIIGEWLREERTKKTIYSFYADGSVLQERDRIQGTWKPEGGNLYLVQWKSGITSKLEMRNNDTLDVNGGSFALTRQKDPLVGKWDMVTGDNSGIVFTFTSDHHADNGNWSRTGKWAKTEDVYRITWNNGKWLDLTLDGDNALDVIDSKGTKRRLVRK